MEPSVIDALVAQSEGLKRVRPGPKCELSKWLRRLPDDETRADALAVLGERRIHPDVALEHLGADTINAEMVTWHRNGRCKGCLANGTFPAS